MMLKRYLKSFENPKLTRVFSSSCYYKDLFQTNVNQIEMNQSKKAHLLQLNNEKELIFKILQTIPSKREAKSYLQKIESISNNTSIQSKKESKFPIALITLTVPMDQQELQNVTETLANIQRLGIAPILILDNKRWTEVIPKQINGFRAIQQMMINDGMAICDMIESSNAKTSLIASGTLEVDPINQKNLKVDLSSILSSLRCHCIPVVLPIASTSEQRHKITTKFSTLAALSKCFSRYADEPAMIHDKAGDVLKVIVINSRGGIPKVGGGTHNFINLQDELEGLVIEANTWQHEKIQNNKIISASNITLTSTSKIPISKENFNEIPEWKLDLDLAYSSLAYLPATTSAVVLSAKTIRDVIGNIITDKPYASPSLPNDTKDESGYTVLRYGLKVVTHSNLDRINFDRLFNLLESSFQRQLDRDKYLQRLHGSLSHIIIAGDYQGVAIVTQERDGINYLDKFSVSPQSQGIGVADVLWQTLRHHCQDLMWRSRIDNGVNKWYFERSDGTSLVPGSQWRCFWFGDQGLKNLKTYLDVAEKIPATFTKGHGWGANNLPPK